MGSGYTGGSAYPLVRLSFNSLSPSHLFLAWIKLTNSFLFFILINLLVVCSLWYVSPISSSPSFPQLSFRSRNKYLILLAPVPLYFFSFNHSDGSPSFSDFVPFGGWTKPNIKQYQGTTSLCSAGMFFLRLNFIAIPLFDH